MKNYWWLISKTGRIIKHGAEDNDKLIHAVMWMSQGVWNYLPVENMYYAVGDDGDFFFVVTAEESREPHSVRVRAALDAAIDDYETQKSGRA